MRCVRCGNENSDENRFCGMCGVSLLTASVPIASTSAQEAAARSTALPSPADSVPELPPTLRADRTPESEDAPVISGPSFLGLNEPAPAAQRRGSLSIDPSSAPSSSNLDYLLHDDEEETRRGGGGKYVLILLALALAVGLGYLRWKNHGFGQISDTTKPPASQTSEAPDANATAPQPVNSTSAPAGTPTPATTSAPPTAAPTTVNATGQAATGSALPAGSPAATTTAPGPTNVAPPDNSSPARAAAVPPTASASDAASNPAQNTPAASSPEEPATTPPAANAASATSDAPNTVAATNPKSSQAAAAPRLKPSPAINSVKPLDPVSEAQKYIYGRGVTQNCDRGMRLLKPAADQENPKAMVEMGALYSAGLCTPHDLPTAYRWFALALRKDPDNQSVQTDLEKLWGEMTLPERQLAIKLSQ